jgi:SAM-dependent methyltransferase
MAAAGGTCFLKFEYFFDRVWQREWTQQALLEAAQYPQTLRLLEALNIGAGWRCLVVGAGSGTTAAWLCQRVGPRGSVLATDSDPRFLYGLDYPNLTASRCDVLVDTLPVAAFDCIYARLTYQPVWQRQQACARLGAALKPGGWLLVEEGAAGRPVPDSLVTRVA